MNNDNILLSIIIPTYNCEEFIDEGIISILSQLPDNCELILVDDGSEDNTRDVISKYENCKSNVKVIYNKHQGASGSRNLGIDNARGRYITFMDCDDMMQEHFLENSLPLTDSYEDLYIFGIERFPIDGDSEVWGVRDNIYESNHTFADAFIRGENLMTYSNCNKFYKKSIIDSVNLRFREGMEFGEDRLFNFDYFNLCTRRIVTSSLLQIKYLQRSKTSMSTKPIPDYCDILMNLHKAKVDCFTTLSLNTSAEEKEAFIKRDFENAKKSALERENN